MFLTVGCGLTKISGLQGKAPYLRVLFCCHIGIEREIAAIAIATLRYQLRVLDGHTVTLCGVREL